MGRIHEIGYGEVPRFFTEGRVMSVLSDCELTMLPIVGFRFIRSEEDDAEASWEQRLARKYYAKLFKEYSPPPPCWLPLFVNTFKY